MKSLLLLLSTLALFLLICYRAMFWMPDGALAEVRAKPNAQTREIQDWGDRHIQALATQIGERHAGKQDALNRAADYIHRILTGIGYAVTEERFGDAQSPFRNLYVEIAGRSPRRQIIVVGAHYDTVPGSPGADDNASGVSALLELARLLKDHKPEHTLRFVAFANEEAPFANTDLMGSRIHAQNARKEAETILAMISLESIGIYDDLPNSQQYPPLVRRFYPDRGNFLGFVANLRNRGLVHRAILSFRQAKRFPSQGIAAPESLVPDITRSDHASFWAAGYPALMVTDTTNFRTPYYHQPDDRPEHLDLESWALVVQGLREVLIDLAER